MPRLFSYGTLQQDNVQLSTFGRLVSGVPDELLGVEEFVIDIDDPEIVAVSGKRQHSVVRLNRHAPGRVRGTVFEITDAELASADTYEVAVCIRVAVTLASGTRAWVYIDARAA